MKLIPNVSLPDAERGPWRLEKFTIDKHDAAMALFSYKGRAPDAGTYTRLMRGHTVVMSDTPAEKRDHVDPVLKADGHILLNGLGIGMVLNACLKKPTVTKATVIEISQDLIDIVGPHYLKDERVEIIRANALTYSPPKGVRYGMVWHDIWDNICPDNLPDMHKLHRKYGRRCGWQGSWARWQCER